MIPVSTLYDEYIDRRKLTEQKKPIWVYSSSPLKSGRNNYSRWKIGFRGCWCLMHNWRRAIVKPLKVMIIQHFISNFYYSLSYCLFPWTVFEIDAYPSKILIKIVHSKNFFEKSYESWTLKEQRRSYKI